MARIEAKRGPAHNASISVMNNLDWRSETHASCTIVHDRPDPAEARRLDAGGIAPWRLD
jgi:hypothetical protein